jgi:uncharacterized protein (DUF1800 family)
MATFDYNDAAHLLRRMGFGGPPDEINSLLARGREGAVDYLLNYDQINHKKIEKKIKKTFKLSRFRSPFDLQRWWIARMIMTERPFQEKMTIFWHNHFATSYLKVVFFFMYAQNQIFRNHALDRFDTLLLKVSQDAAMLVWLDGITNVVGSPNENFARELQELFTMGVTDVVTGEANYTEKDVKEIARACTGWAFTVNQSAPHETSFLFIPARHDNGAKQIYGQTANFSGEDVIEIVSARRSTARYLVAQFFQFFVYPLTDSFEDKATIEKFADVYLASDHSIKAVARAIFTSDEFFSPRARFALVKSPAEYLVGAIRMLGADYEPGTPSRPDFSLLLRLREMGLELFNPRDVDGWEGGLGWLNTATMLERYNVANGLLTARPVVLPALGAWVGSDKLRALAGATAQQTVERFLTALGPLNVPPEAAQALVEYLETDDQGNPASFALSEQTIDKSVRGLVYLIMCMPEFQMN